MNNRITNSDNRVFLTILTFLILNIHMNSKDLLETHSYLVVGNSPSSASVSE